MTDEKKDDDSLFVDATDRYRGYAVIFSPEPVRCPLCGSTEIREIVYGLPPEPVDPDSFHLGGCVVQDEDWHCAACGNDWA